MFIVISMNSGQVIIYAVIALFLLLGIQKLWHIMIQKMESRLEQNAVEQSPQTIEANINPTELDIILYVDNWIRKPTKATEKPPIYFLNHASLFLPYLAKVIKNYPDLEMRKELTRLYEDIQIFEITQ
jgi:hypothetical protein